MEAKHTACSKALPAGGSEQISGRKCLSLLHFGLPLQKDGGSLQLMDLNYGSCTTLLWSRRRDASSSMGCR